MKKKIATFLIVSAIASAMTLTAYALPAPPSAPIAPPSPLAAPPSPLAAPPAPPAPISLSVSYTVNTEVNITAEEAQNIALSSVGGGTIARTETHYPPHGGAEYKVLVVSGDYRYCVHIDGYDGSVTNNHADLITKVGPLAYGYSAAVSAESAKSIAVENAGGGVATDCNLDYKPHIGALAYHIHVMNGQYEYCVELSADTGAVYKVEQRYKP